MCRLRFGRFWMLSDPSTSDSKTRHQKAASVVVGNLSYDLYCLRCPRLAIVFLVASLSLQIGLALLAATCRTTPTYTYFSTISARSEATFAMIASMSACSTSAETRVSDSS